MALEGLRDRQRDYGQWHGRKPVALERRRSGTNCLRRELVLARDHTGSWEVSLSSESRLSCEIDNCRLHRVGARPPAGEAGYPAQGRISSCAPELLRQSSAARQKA